jgi:hypothetical protein
MSVLYVPSIREPLGSRLFGKEQHSYEGKESQRVDKWGRDDGQGGFDGLHGQSIAR